MPSRSFTVAEVNALIPQLELIFRESVQLRGLLRKQEQGLERLGLSVSRDILDGDVKGDPAPVREAKLRFRATYEVLGESLQRVSTLGGDVKDLESGLVDFPHRHDGDLVLLCWKLGEKAITHWHTLDGGFAGRKAIAELGVPTTASEPKPRGPGRPAKAVS